MTLFLSSHIKNADRDELHDMIQECMDDGPEIPELRQQVKLIFLDFQKLTKRLIP